MPFVFLGQRMNQNQEYGVGVPGCRAQEIEGGRRGMKNSNSLGRVVDSSSLVCLTDPCWISHPLSLLADPDISDNTKSADINSHNSQMCHYSSSSSSSFQYLSFVHFSFVHFSKCFWKCISFNEELCRKKMIYHSTLGIQMHI